MSSFYGGKQGVSFVIKDRFKYISREDQAYQNALNVINKDGTIDDNTKQASIEKLDEQTMLVQFANPNYKQCWYGEYIIIDSDNKNSRNNGKIYRRTLKGHGNISWASGGDQTDDNCAEYVGQITGPAGDTPIFHLGSLKEAQTAFKETETVFGAESYYLDNNGNPSSANYDTKVDNQIGISSLNNNVAVPGADVAAGLADRTKYKDSIKWQWVNIRMPDQVRTNKAGEFVDDLGKKLDHETLKWKDTHVYVGLEIPYSVFNFTAEEANYMEKASISRILKDDEKVNSDDPNETPDSHPYYYHEHLIIPRGIDGSKISNIRLRTANDFSVGGNTEKDTLYDGAPVYHADGKSERYTISQITETNLKEYIKGDYTAPFNFKDTDNSWKNVKFWVYDFSWYEKEPVKYIVQDGKRIPIYETTKTIYLGSYEEIKSASIDNEGTIKIQYNIHNETWDKQLKWIEGLNFSGDGTVTLTMNNDQDITSNGTHSEKNWTWTKLLTWITGMTVDIDKTSSTYGLVSINFNNNKTQANISKYLPLPKELEFNKNTGKITLKVVKNQSETYDLTTTGIIEYPNELSLIGDIDSANTSTYFADRHIQYSTNILSDPKNLISIGSPINYIQDVVLPTGDDDFHLYVLYNDPTHRPKIVDGTKVEYKGQTLESPAAIITPITVIDNNVLKQVASEISITMTGTYTDNNGVEKTQEIKTYWKNNIQGSDGTTFNESVFWQDFGSLKTIQTGGLIAGEITPNKDYWPQNTDQYNQDTFEDWGNVLKQLNWEGDYQPENIPQLAAGHLYIYTENGIDKIWYGVNNAEPPVGAKNCTGQILIARIPDENDDSKISTHYFVYDFINKGWKDLGGIDANNGAGGTIVQGTDFSENSTTKIDSSLKKGLFFLSTEYTITNTPTLLSSTPWE